ncbi:helix-turn-helix domain-containing protein [Micromonospora chalcea]|uniref:helix-turn-helix domain-containing protein n=1 Tax=Micromonospora chalcea TaxID=1874 RepID=UPI003D744442
MTQPSLRVGQSVAELRRARGLTTRALSDRLDEIGRRIPQSSLSKIEAGKRAVDVDDLVALAIALRTTPNRLLFGPRAGIEPVSLTPTYTTTGHRAWAWANGEYPLTSTYPKDMIPEEVWDEWNRSAHPVDFRLRRSHPAARAARRLAAMVDAFVMFLASDGSGELEYVATPGGDEPFRRKDPAQGGRDLFMGENPDPAAIVDDALRRATREVGDLIQEAGGVNAK